MARGPGPIAAVHRLLIVSALLCALLYALWELREMGRGAGALAGVRAVAALGAGVGLAVYLRSLRRLRARLTPADDPSPPPR
jgi:hypothetical protein